MAEQNIEISESPVGTKHGTKLFFLFCFLLVPFSILSQNNFPCPSSADKKAVKYLSDAVKARKDKKDYSDVKKLFMRATDQDSAFAEAWNNLGDAAYYRKDFNTMAEAYEKLISLCPDAGADAYYRLGNYYYEKEKFGEAKTCFKKFLEFDFLKETHARDAELKIFRSRLRLSPVPFNPVPVNGISTKDPEYLAIISADNELCFFTRRYDYQDKNSITSQSNEKFMISRNINGEFEKGVPLPAPFNRKSSNNEGGPSISIDNTMLFFTVNDGGNFDIYYSISNNGYWDEIKNLGTDVNDPLQWDSQPAIAPDGKTLYFVSYRDSIHRTSDIYRTKLVNGVWQKPERLPSVINTNGNEKSPFIHPDNKTFYFSSDSLPGMGGMDIYVSRKDEKGNWSEPVNLGYPINTDADEVGFFVSTDGRKGYFASNSLKGVGGYDIYSFDIPVEAKPEKVLFLKGEVKDEEENLPLAARIEIKNMITKEVLEIEYDTLTGKYASVLPFKHDYLLTISKEGYAFNSKYYSLRDSTLEKPVNTEMKMRKMEVGKSYTLNNIYFATDSWVLSDTDKAVIESFSEFLKQNPSIKVAIHGHTDNSGSPSSNLSLSKNRANAVYDYLVKLGIDTSHLSYEGFGQSKPVASNSTEEGKALNRRTEFYILGK